jgi:predicted MFS family arabinose efflux permease
MSGFTGHEPGSREYRRLILALFFAGVATFAQMYSPQGVLPSIADAFDVPPATASLTISVTTLGLAIAVIPWSVVADRIGRVPAMAIGVIAATAIGAAVPASGGVGMMLALRFGEGLALGAVPAIALAYLNEEVTPKSAAAAAGAYISGTSIGGLVGRVVVGPFADFGAWRVGILVADLVCVVSTVLFLVLVPGSRGFTPHRLRAHRGPSLLHRLAANLRSPRQLVLYAQAFLLMGGFVAIYNYLGFRLQSPPFELQPWAVSLLFLAYLAGAFASPQAGQLAVRHGRQPVLLVSIAVIAAGVGMTMTPWLAVVIVGLLVLTAGFFSAHAVASGWAPADAVPDARAQASSLYYLGYYGGSSLFGWCLGLVFAAVGWTGLAVSVVLMGVAAAVLAWAALRTPALATRVRSSQDR